jgi:hypothetical protein
MFLKTTEFHNTRISETKLSSYLFTNNYFIAFQQ